MATVLKLKLGSKILEVSTDNKGEKMIEDLAFWSGLPDRCNSCGKDTLSLFCKKPKKGVYYGLKCLNCGAELTFHQHEADKSFYITKEDSFNIFAGKAISDDAGV